MTQTHSDPAQLLTINTGSSSLKAALYGLPEIQQQYLSVEIDRIGLSGSRIHISPTRDGSPLIREMDLSSHAAALHTLFDVLQRHGSGVEPKAVGHRVVHGGREYREPQFVSDDLVHALRGLVSIDPNHLPQAIEAIEAVSQAFPTIPQIVCFDTAFHRHMPRVAQMYALPRELGDAGLVRYGFHGLSYEYIMHELRTLDSAAASGRIVIAHLGNGASMAAVLNGTGIDTTMGLTPTGGLVMGTRSGDLDPGVLLYLLESQGMSPQELNALVNRQAGMLGISGISGDMHDLLDREATDSHAAEAVELFCYQARKFLGALTASLGGLDTLVFTGGIGEHAAPVRERICSALGYLGISLDAERNAHHAPIISAETSCVTVRVMKTDEDLTIARHTYRLISEGTVDHLSI